MIVKICINFICACVCLWMTVCQSYPCLCVCGIFLFLTPVCVCCIWCVMVPHMLCKEGGGRSGVRLCISPTYILMNVATLWHLCNV